MVKILTMKVLLLAVILPLQALALETDNYIVWGQELKNSSKHINHFFQENIALALQNIPAHENKSCEEMTKLIGRDFASHLVHDNPVENWLFQRLTSEEMYPQTMNYVSASIYRAPYLFYIPWFGLAPNIQVNGFYFGTDKLSHFASTGMIYYRIYKQELALGKSQEEGMVSAINWGIRDEKTLHGFWASGVFSYGDLESNFQGLLFYRNFCEGQNSYLSKGSDGQWKLNKSPDITKYVSAYWDETFELSYRLPENWKKVSKEIRRYCQDSRSPEVLRRFKYYKKSIQSFSGNYLRAQKSAGLLPSPSPDQSFEMVCSEFL